jgi:hypothetical protein
MYYLKSIRKLIADYAYIKKLNLKKVQNSILPNAKASSIIIHFNFLLGAIC